MQIIFNKQLWTAREGNMMLVLSMLFSLWEKQTCLGTGSVSSSSTTDWSSQEPRGHLEITTVLSFRHINKDIRVPCILSDSHQSYHSRYSRHYIVPVVPSIPQSLFFPWAYSMPGIPILLYSDVTLSLKTFLGTHSPLMASLFFFFFLKYICAGIMLQMSP